MDDGNGTFDHVHTDHLGSTRLTTRGNNVLASQEYEPWGQVIQSQGVIPLSIGFTGHEMDVNDGVHPGDPGYTLTYNFGARRYAPPFGRFMSPDPARDPSSWSLYGYAGGNPMMFVDPDGRLRIKASLSEAGVRYRVVFESDGYEIQVRRKLEEGDEDIDLPLSDDPLKWAEAAAKVLVAKLVKKEGKEGWYVTHSDINEKLAQADLEGQFEEVFNKEAYMVDAFYTEEQFRDAMGQALDAVLPVDINRRNPSRSTYDPEVLLRKAREAAGIK